MIYKIGFERKLTGHTIYYARLKDSWIYFLFVTHEELLYPL